MAKYGAGFRKALPQATAAMTMVPWPPGLPSWLGSKYQIWIAVLAQSLPCCSPSPRCLECYSKASALLESQDHICLDVHGSSCPAQSRQLPAYDEASSIRSLYVHTNVWLSVLQRTNATHRCAIWQFSAEAMYRATRLSLRILKCRVARAHVAGLVIAAWMKSPALPLVG